MRDTQKSAVYAAENLIGNMLDRTLVADNPVVQVGGTITLTLPPEARYASIESIQSYVDRVQAHPAVREAFPGGSERRVTVRARRGATKAHYEGRTRDDGTAVIAIPDQRSGWAMRETVILHELAHHYAPGAGHGPAFTSALKTLFGAVMGPEMELLARVVFDTNGVK